MGKKELVALFLLSSWCFVTVGVLWLFLTVPWIGLQCVVVMAIITYFFASLNNQSGGFAMPLCASVYMCTLTYFVITCYEMADLLALVCGV